MTTPDNEGQFGRILETATRLFAALGYDGTSVPQIAEAAGVETATIIRQFGNKRDLYLTVMESAHQKHLAMLETAVKELTAAPPDQKIAAVHRFVDLYVDFCAQHPEFPALYMHRWLADASDIRELEAQYVRPAAEFVIAAIAPLITEPDVDLPYTINSLVWCVHSFVHSGVLDRRGIRHGPDDPRALRRFRRHMHRMVHLSLRLPGELPTA